MRYFPMFLDMAGRTVVLAGGGEQVAQKSRLLKRTDARLVLMAEDLIPELVRLVESGRAEHVSDDVDQAAIAAADFIFVATEDEALDLEIADYARAGGAVVNVVDKPDQCDMITPALVDRDPVVIAIGTEGAAPVVAKRVKTDLEQSLSDRLGPFVAMLARLRDEVAASVEDGPARLAFWNWAAFGAPWAAWSAGDEAEAEAMVRAAAAAGAPPVVDGAPAATIAMVEIPAAADLLSLRAVRRLQQAAVIFHPPAIDEGVLELARRDAERRVVPGCPRGDAAVLAAIARAAAAGPVVVLATAACDPGASPPLGPSERVASAPAAGDATTG